MRRLVVGLAAVAVAACGGKEQMSAELREDLALVSSAEALTLAGSQPGGATVVSDIERTIPRTPAPAPSARAPQPRPAPRAPIQAAPRPAVQEPEYAAASQPAPPPPLPVEDRGPDGMGEAAVVAGRPQPVPSSGTGTVGSSGGSGGGGIGIGTVIAGIGIAVIRGGVVVGDVHCPPPPRRTPTRRSLPNESAGGGIQATVRGIPIPAPVGRGTFPGSTVPRR